jgi:transposase
MGRPRVPLSLTEEEATTLTMWARAGKTEQRLVQRALTILGAAEGLPWQEVCARTGLSLTNSLKWVQRFRQQRLEGLYDRPRPGGRRRYTPAEQLGVWGLVRQPPPQGHSHWTLDALAAHSGMGRASVHRLLRQAQLQPHRVDYWCGRSPDPEFARKAAEIVGLYLDPPDHALVIAVDEKTQIQALDRTQPELPLRPGQPRRQTVTYTRHGTVSLLAALVVHEGQVQGRCVQRHTHQEFLAFLKYLYRKYPGHELHVICDNFAAHKHQAVRKWVAQRRRLTLHFTPTYASWLNQVEIWFSLLSRQLLRGAVWRSRSQLVAALLDYIARYNQTQAHPFRWTYTGRPQAA